MPSSDRVRPDEETTDVVGARVGAQVVDTVALFLQLFLVAFALAAVLRPESEGAVRGLGFLALLTLPLYGTVLEGLWNGQTVGKRLVGIKVVARDGTDPSLGQAFGRNLPAVVLFSWLAVVVALVAIATDDERQRVFDRLAGTYVVDADPGPSVPERHREDDDAFEPGGTVGDPPWQEN